MKLVIVESPSKAKTISRYLGKDFCVRASVGHIRNLPKNNEKAIEIKNNFKPHYEIIPGKEPIIDELKKLSKKSKEVYLATDPDREGEAIAWHISQILDLKEPKRIVFHEITKEAFEAALNHPKKIDLNLKTAQEARRVLDRLFGFDLSGLIWKKVRYGLSAGRVQSPALRIIMEKEREIRKFKSEKYFVLSAETKTKKNEKINFTCSVEPRNAKDADYIMEKAPTLTWKISQVKETQVRKFPRAPFVTSTLQQAASNYLGFSPSRTMRIAQKLYESGLITYMRTDSVTLSENAKKQIAGFVSENFGTNYLQLRDFPNKSKNAQEAHEAIRPTKISLEKITGGSDQAKLYDLIWIQTVASQMKEANTIRTSLVIEFSDKKIPYFSANGNQLLFDGFLKIDHFSKKEKIVLPAVQKGETLELIKIKKEEKETTPPPRYSEAGLIKELEKRGIGRPSTYASIIRTIQERGYVVKENKALFPTDTGEVVNSFLEKNFTNYISDTFTADLEDQLDLIAQGKKEYETTLSNFYQPFSKEIKTKEKETPKATTLGKAEKEFKCPKCGGPMVIKLGKNGKFLGCKKYPDCDGILSLEGKKRPADKKLKEICPECGGSLVEKTGKFGKFIACSNYPKCKFVKQNKEQEEKNKTGVKCPLCKEGEMVEKRGRFGIFYACNNYPKCKYTVNAKPTGKKCSLCGMLMIEGTKTIPERCSNKECPKHNPPRKK